MIKEREKKVRRSPVGVAVYPHLSKPTKSMDGTKDIWEVRLKLNPEKEEVRDFLKELHDETKAKYPKGRPPYKDETDRDTEEDTGMVLVEFKSAYPPKIWDKYGEKIEDENIVIGGGSLIQVAFVPSFYDVAGKKGMNLYLQAVKVLELVEYRGMNASDYFDVEPKEENLEENPFAERSEE